MLSPSIDRALSIAFPEDRPISSFEGRWWVAHTKSRFEKAFASDLKQKGISYFLPLMPRTHLLGGSARKFLLPLFPSYVFFCGTGGQRIDALGTGRLCQVINVADQSSLIDELSQLQTALKTSQNIDRCKIPLGNLCVVRKGPMLGCKGFVVENHKVTRLVLQISILGQGFSLEIDRDLLEPVESDLRATPARIAV